MSSTDVRSDGPTGRAGAGKVDLKLEVVVLGDQLDARREQLRATLPIGRPRFGAAPAVLAKATPVSPTRASDGGDGSSEARFSFQQTRT